MSFSSGSPWNFAVMSSLSLSHNCFLTTRISTELPCRRTCSEEKMIEIVTIVAVVLLGPWWHSDTREEINRKKYRDRGTKEATEATERRTRESRS